MGNTGVLDQPTKGLISKNFRELSSIDTNLMAVSGGAEIKTILVTSCSAREGKTVSAISLASALADKSGTKTALVDVNVQAPMLHKLFGVGAMPGFTDMVLADANLADVIRDTEFNNLSIIPFGTEYARKLDAFEANKFKNVLHALNQEFTHIIFDGPSVFGSPAVPLIARHFDGILFVLECEKTRWGMLQEATKKVKSTGGKTIGAVLNKRKFYVPRWFYGF